MRPTFAYHIQSDTFDNEEKEFNYADIYGLIDSPPEDMDPEEYGMTQDEFGDYIYGFERNRDRALEIAGEYITDEERETAIDEVLTSNE